MKNRYFKYSVFSFVAIMAIWCVLTYTGYLKPMYLPTPSSVWQAIGDMYRDGSLWTNIGFSVYRIMVGWAISAIVALPIGMMTATSKKIKAIFQPITEFARYLPVTALVPLTIIYTGIGEEQKFTIIFLGTFFQLILMVNDAVSGVDKKLINAAKTLGTNKFQMYTKVIFPAALPNIMDSFRLTIGWAWTYLVVAEMISADSGLGYMILKAQRFVATDRVFAGLILIGLIGLLTDYLFRLLTKLIVPWFERLGDE
jgi:NitT/TauT family transport system permease protein